MLKKEQEQRKCRIVRMCTCAFGYVATRNQKIATPLGSMSSKSLEQIGASLTYFSFR